MALAVGNRVLVSETEFTNEGWGVITKITTVLELERENKGMVFYHDRIEIKLDTGTILCTNPHNIIQVLPSLEDAVKELRTAQACGSHSNVMSAWLKLSGMVHTEGQNLGFVKK